MTSMRALFLAVLWVAHAAHAQAPAPPNEPAPQPVEQAPVPAPPAVDVPPPPPLPPPPQPAPERAGEAVAPGAGGVEPPQPQDAARATSAPEVGVEAPSEEEVLAPIRVGPSETVGEARPRGELISGAPLENPDVAVHIVQQKRFADRGRHELTLYPVVPQVNGKFTRHLGTAISYQFHLQEHFGLQLSGQYNWVGSESDFNAELIDKVKESAQAASTLLVEWGAYGGFEVKPFYGKFAFYKHHLAQFSVVINAGAGVVSTRHQLVPEGRDEDGLRTVASHGDTGMRFMGQVGAGFRVQLGERFALRLEVRDLVYTARVDRVNGCSLSDIDSVIDGGSQVSSGCRIEAFEAGGHRNANLRIARDLIQEPSSDAINLINFYAGASILF